MCKCCETIEFWKESEKDKNSRLFAKIAVYTWRKGEKRIKGNQYFDYTTRAYDLKHCPSCRTKNWTKSDEREVKKMCKYCEKEKKLEEVENDNIYFEIWGKHLQVTGKVLGIPLGRDIIIEYCPMCRKEVRRVRAKYIKTMDFLFEKVNILNCKSSSELAEKIKENEVIKIDNYGSI